MGRTSFIGSLLIVARLSSQGRVWVWQMTGIQMVVQRVEPIGRIAMLDLASFLVKIVAPITFCLFKNVGAFLLDQFRCQAGMPSLKSTDPKRKTLACPVIAAKTQVTSQARPKASTRQESPRPPYRREPATCR